MVLILHLSYLNTSNVINKPPQKTIIWTHLKYLNTSNVINKLVILNHLQELWTYLNTSNVINKPKTIIKIPPIIRFKYIKCY